MQGFYSGKKPVHRCLTGRYKQWTRDQGTRGPMGIQLFLELVLGTSASSLAANPLFEHHDASYDVYQLEL